MELKSRSTQTRVKHEILDEYLNRCNTFAKIRRMK